MKSTAISLTKWAFVLLLLLPAAPAVRCQTWDDLNRRPYPQWFADAKLGIFVHWGLYSVPAYASKEGYAEWLYKGLMSGDEGRLRAMSFWADTTLPVHEMYAQLTGHWHAELWQPAAWARLFREAGAGYVVLVTKHHDGYCLWDSPQQPVWNSVASGPRRNIVAELTEAVRAEGLRMGFYYSLPEWSNPRHRWTVDPDSAIGDYVDNYMVPQFKELVARYKPSLVFADGDWQNSADEFRSTELIDWYYRTVGPDAIVNDRWGRGTQHGFRTPEYSDGLDIVDRPWAECRGLGRSFGLNRNEDLDNYLTSTELIQHFCSLVAHGGGLTLNVGPCADGTIPLLQQERLRDLGRWLQVNGEAVYGSRPWNNGADSRHADREHRSMPMPPSTQIDCDWVRNAPLKGMPVDNFEIHWQGRFETSGHATCYIKAVADDEITVVHEGDTILHHNHAWAANNDVYETGRMDAAGHFDMDIYYRERDLEASVSLLVSHDGVHYTPMPLEGLQGIATWQRTVRCFTQKGGNLYVIEFERPGSTLEIPAMPRLKKGTEITLLGTTGSVRWKQRKDDTLVLDLDALDPKELAALGHAWVIKIVPAR